VALSGTSMAAPFVSGAAALLFSAKPEARVGEIRNAILKSTSPGAFPATTRGQLNIRRALEALTDLN
ncbi:MAG: S8 family serine peptidase, partial [Bdellovibrionales bacterium]|nr:S8 family serine peptidase [Bdellovibrionales bacterium]